MKMHRNALLGLAASVLLCGSALAQGTMAPGNADTKSTANGGVMTSDRKFMDKAAQGGMAEVELGQLAQQNGQSDQVKAFGKRMVDDHTKAGDQLKQLAQQKGVALPTTLDAKDQATKDRLSKLQGAAFDKAYMKDMVADHKQDVAEFKKASMSAHDPQLKDWATQTLPTLESHLQEAEKVNATVSGGKSMGMNSGSGANSGNGMSASAQ